MKRGAIFIILWRGGGILVPVIAVVAVIAAASVKLSGAAHPAIMVVGLLLGAAAIWFLGRRMNSRDNGAHTFFFIPMQYWSLALVGLALIAAFSKPA